MCVFEKYVFLNTRNDIEYTRAFSLFIARPIEYFVHVTKYVFWGYALMIKLKPLLCGKKDGKLINDNNNN